MINEETRFVAEIMSCMHQETTAITNSLLEYEKEKVKELQDENWQLKSQLATVRRRLAWLMAEDCDEY